MTTSSDANLAYLLLRGFRWFEQGLRADPEIAHLPQLTPGHILVLATLDDDGTSISELARRVGVTRQAMHQTVGDLIKMALVETSSSPKDKRVKLVKLTLLGRTLDEKATEAMDRLEGALQAKIGAKSISELRKILGTDWG